MTELKSLQLYACPFVTLHGLEKFMANSVSVAAVAVQECRLIKLDLIQLRKMSKKLRVTERTTVEKASPPPH